MKIQKGHLKIRFLNLTALLATPLLIFVSTTNELYIKNQASLDYNIQVLVPFYILFLISLLIGLFLYILSTRKVFRYLLWVYCLNGLFFIIYSLLRKEIIHLLNTPAGFVFSLLLFLFTVHEIDRRKSLREKIVKSVAFISLGLVIVEICLFTIRLNFTVHKNRAYHKTARDSVKPSSLTKSGDHNIEKEQLPNIYHFVFDEFQTDMFRLALTTKTKKKLNGFVWFPNNTTVYGRTGMSLSSVFLGKAYDYNTSQIDYQKEAFNSQKSLLHWLKKSGYTTYEYISKFSTFRHQLFDHSLEHKKNLGKEIKIDYFSVFKILWLYTNLPNFIAERLIEPETFHQIQNQNLLTDTAPIQSYVSFLNIMKEEKYMSDSNRYTFIHLLIPHFPNVLGPDCSYKIPVEKTTPVEQSRCAIKLISDFVGLLKEINRFENSIIIIHADHGSRYTVEDSSLKSVENRGHYSVEFSRARSKALLLIKPRETRRDNEFAISDFESSLLDIAPTISEGIDLNTNIKFDGISLLKSNLTSLSPRTRYYHFYDKKGPDEQTDSLTRFIIKGNEISFDQVIPL